MTKEQVKSTMNVVMAVSEAIRELKRVPSGELYTRVMGFMDLNTYNRIIELLKDAGVVTEVNHELIWKAAGGRWD